MAAARRITHIFFDLDGCLYPTSSPYHMRIRKNLWRYMEEDLHIEHPITVWRPLFKKYNQSLRGLIAEGYQVDAARYWESVRQGTKDLLAPAPPGVGNLLASLPQSKERRVFLVTNCGEKQAREALEVLGISSFFDKIYGSDFMHPFCKPERQALEKVLAACGAEPETSALFEDSHKNLVAARSLGMATILVKGETLDEEAEGVPALDLSILDAVIAAPTEELVRQAAPWLWGCNE